MRVSPSRKQFAAFALSLLAGLTYANASRADLFVSRKEIDRESEVQWLDLKKHTPKSPPQVQRYVQCVTDDLIKVLPEQFQKLDWEIQVFDSGELNAFAMPGGKVGVYSGILRVADTPDALAAVLGHEIAHLTQDHVYKRARKESRNEVFDILGSAAGIGDVASTGTTLLLSLPYDRKQESQADLVGLNYMAKAGFDPRASINLWKNMMAQNKGAPPEFLSNHPADDRRLDDLIKHLAPALVEYNKARGAGHRPSCHM